MARKRPQSSEGAPEWMTTYSDLVTLLLTFFILLFSMATIDKNRFTEIAASLSHTILNMKGGESLLQNSNNSIIAIDLAAISNEVEEGQKEKQIEDAEDMVVDAEERIKAEKLDEVKSNIRDIISEKGISDKVQVTEEKDFLLIRLDQEVFFDSGSADIRPTGMDVLSAVSESLRSIENEIMVSGHTDNVPIHNANFSSNWELSTARATNVVKYFVDVEKLNPTLFTATGNGEFRPVADNNTPEGRQKNRRIEIKILK